MHSWAITALVGFFFYKVTHRMEMESREIGILFLVQLVGQVLMWYYVALGLLAA